MPQHRDESDALTGKVPVFFLQTWKGTPYVMRDVAFLREDIAEKLFAAQVGRPAKPDEITGKRAPDPEAPPAGETERIAVKFDKGAIGYNQGEVAWFAPGVVFALEKAGAAHRLKPAEKKALTQTVERHQQALERIPLKLLRSIHPNVKGEVAWFTRDEARVFVKRQFAEYVRPEDAVEPEEGADGVQTSAVPARAAAHA